LSAHIPFIYFYLLSFSGRPNRQLMFQTTFWHVYVAYCYYVSSIFFSGFRISIVVCVRVHNYVYS
jgi:hypothetical protein